MILEGATTYILPLHPTELLSNTKNVMSILIERSLRDYSHLPVNVRLSRLRVGKMYICAWAYFSGHTITDLDATLLMPRGRCSTLLTRAAWWLMLGSAGRAKMSWQSSLSCRVKTAAKTRGAHWISANVVEGPEILT